METLASLVDKSLLVAHDRAATWRYRFLEPTRAFAQQLLEPNARRELALLHATWIAESLQNAEDRVCDTGITVRFAELTREFDNIRAALRSCERDEEFALGKAIAGRIADLFYWNGLADEGCRWIQRALSWVGDERDVAVEARLWCGLARLTGETSIRLDASERAVALAEQCRDINILIASYIRRAVALYLVGRLDEALAASDRVFTMLRPDAEPADQRAGWALQHRSWMFIELGRIDEARACIEDAIRIFQQRNAEREAWGLCGDLAELEFAAGNAERALHVVDEAIPVLAASNDPERESVFTCNRAGYLLRLGDLAEAEATAREAVVLAHKTHGAERVLHALEHLAAALASRERLEPAALLAGFVDAGYAGSGYQRETTERSSHDILTALLRDRLPHSEMTAFMSRGASMSADQALALATKKSQSGALPD
jgi:tetratricopeptide (TPR) repeat protein